MTNQEKLKLAQAELPVPSLLWTMDGFQFCLEDREDILGLVEGEECLTLSLSISRRKELNGEDGDHPYGMPFIVDCPFILLASELPANPDSLQSYVREQWANFKVLLHSDFDSIRPSASSKD